MIIRPYIFTIACIAGALALSNVNSMHAAYDFSYYEQKTRTFLNYYGCSTHATVSIQPIQQTEKRPGWIISAFTNSTGIYLNMEEFEHNHYGINLFTCAHEAAHWAFHSEHLKITYDLEQDADIKAAEMLCTYGYAWVVQEKINELEAIIEEDQERADKFNEEKPRPTIRTRHHYLSHILETYLEKHPLQKRILTLHKGWDTVVLIGSNTIVGASCLLAGIKLSALNTMKKVSVIVTEYQ